MKTLKTEFEEITNSTLDEYGVLMVGDMRHVLAQRLYNAFRARKDKDVTCPREWMMAIHKLCGISVVTCSDSVRKEVSRLGLRLISDDATIEQLPEFGAWFVVFSSKWSTRPKFPSLKNVGDYWAQFKMDKAAPPARPMALSSDDAAKRAADAVRL